MNKKIYLESKSNRIPYIELPQELKWWTLCKPERKRNTVTQPKVNCSNTKYRFRKRTGSREKALLQPKKKVFHLFFTFRPMPWNWAELDGDAPRCPAAVGSQIWEAQSREGSSAPWDAGSVQGPRPAGQEKGWERERTGGNLPPTQEWKAWGQLRKGALGGDKYNS